MSRQVINMSVMAVLKRGESSHLHSASQVIDRPSTMACEPTSEEQFRISEESQRPTSDDDHEGWRAYWAAQGMSWRTEPEIDEEKRSSACSSRSSSSRDSRSGSVLREVNGHDTHVHCGGAGRGGADGAASGDRAAGAGAAGGGLRRCGQPAPAAGVR